MTNPALLAAIREAPDDDAPRLILADWWDEHGNHDRAEFCHVQCELAKCRPDCGIGKICRVNPTCTFLRRREQEILNNGGNWIDWSGRTLCNMAEWTWDEYGSKCEWTFRRGFIHSIGCAWADCRDHLDAILDSEAGAGLVSVSLTTQPEIPAGEWRKWAPRVDRAFQLDVAGVEIDVPPHQKQFEAGRTSRWYKQVLSTRWPRIKTWNLPSQAESYNRVSAMIARA